MDTEQYLDVFIDESTEHLDVLYSQLVELEKNPSEKKIMEEIFRAAHTIKGMSATMGFEDVADLTHHMENVLDDIRYGKITVQAHIVDVLFSAVDDLNSMIQDIANGGSGKRDIKKVVKALENIQKGEQMIQTDDSENKTVQKTGPGNGLKVLSAVDEFELAILNESSERGFSSYEISVTLRDDCLLKGVRVFMVFEILEQLGEVIKTDPSVHDLEEENFDLTFTILLVSKNNPEEIKQKINKVSEIDHILINHFSAEGLREQFDEDQKHMATGKEEAEVKRAPSNVEQRQVAQSKTIRVNIERLDILMNLFEELVTDSGRLEQISSELSHGDLQETVERMARTSGDMQNVILNMRMVPVNHVFNRFPSMIRQLSRELNKKINVEITGAETELDRTVIDEIGDPLVHLIRNATDHGIETPEVRIKKGKPEAGTIKLQAYHSGNYVFIEIIDDGAGINKEAVLNKAIENNVIKKEQIELLTDQEIYELIMASGFSTTEVVSDISGRGVGLDVVKNAIEKLGGSISIDSEIDKGSIFSIQLPLTLSIISVLLVELQQEKYAIPLSSVIETVIVKKEDILSAHNQKIIDFRGMIIPLVFLKDVFSVPMIKEDDEYVSVVIVKKGNNTAGLVVDSFIGQHEVVLKSLGNYLTNIKAISGATILGDGEVALIIDSNALVR